MAFSCDSVCTPASHPACISLRTRARLPTILIMNFVGFPDHSPLQTNSTILQTCCCRLHGPHNRPFQRSLLEATPNSLCTQFDCIFRLFSTSVHITMTSNAPPGKYWNRNWKSTLGWPCRQHAERWRIQLVSPRVIDLSILDTSHLQHLASSAATAAATAHPAATDQSCAREQGGSPLPAGSDRLVRPTGEHTRVVLELRLGSSAAV